MRLPRFTASCCLLLIFVLTAVAGPPAGMVFIPGGEFLRGRSHALPDDGLKWFPVLLKDDQPARTIRLDPFYLHEHELTNAEYRAFLSVKKLPPPYYWIGGRIPEGLEKVAVVNVTWNEAESYCAWAGKRLPTEAEWERAARGVAEGAIYPWGDRDPEPEDARFDKIDGPGAVCQFSKNYFGLCDMAGNVWEWVSDWYGRDYYQEAPDASPTGPAEGRYKVIRGGSWADVPKYLTSAHRNWARPAERSPNIGFRCARDFNTR